MSSSEQTTVQDRRMEIVAGVRAFADWLEQHPDADTGNLSELKFFDYQPSRAALLDRIKHLGGPWESDDLCGESNYFGVEKHFGPVTYRVYARRECVSEERFERRAVSVLSGEVADAIASAAVQEAGGPVRLAVDQVMGGAA